MVQAVPALTLTANGIEPIGHSQRKGPDKALFRRRLGGPAKFGWTEYGSTFDAVIEIVDSPSRLAFRWAVLPDTKIEESPSTLVQFTLAALEEGAKVRVVETGFASLPDDLHQRQPKENTLGLRAELQDLIEYLTVDEGV